MLSKPLRLDAFRTPQNYSKLSKLKKNLQEFPKLPKVIFPNFRRIYRSFIISSKSSGSFVKGNMKFFVDCDRVPKRFEGRFPNVSLNYNELC